MVALGDDVDATRIIMTTKRVIERVGIGFLDEDEIHLRDPMRIIMMTKHKVADLMRMGITMRVIKRVLVGFLDQVEIRHHDPTWIIMVVLGYENEGHA